MVFDGFCYKASVICLFIIMIGSSCDGMEVVIDNPSPHTISAERIYGNGSTYCAFTSMVICDGIWYLAFREGVNHKNDNGVIRILRSKDCKNWSLFQVVSAPNIDLRDPNLSIMPNGSMVLICGARRTMEDGTFISTKTFFAKNKDGLFGDLKPISLPETIDDEELSWLWGLTWEGDIGYGAVYRRSDGKSGLSLVRTNDGESYDFITELDVGTIVNETRLRFLNDKTMVAFMRSEGNGFMGISRPPYTDWSYKQLNIYLAGHDFIIDNTKIVCATRTIGQDGEKTVVFYGNTDGSFYKSIELPSYGISGDTSYASIVEWNGCYYISYYSKHETEKPCIYISKIIKDK